jgi:hypothetical protein
MLANTNYSNFKKVLTAYNYFNEINLALKKKLSAEIYGAIREYDAIANEVL